MTLIEIFSILVIHWIADFIFQSHNEAINKSTSNYWLSMHIWTYSIIILIAGIIYTLYNMVDNRPWNLAIVYGITFISHWITDYFTSRWVKYYRLKENYHNMFVVIGFDQLLHYAQLFICYKLLLQ